MRRLTSIEWFFISNALWRYIDSQKELMTKQTNSASEEAYDADIKRAMELVKLVDAGWLAMQEEGDNL